MITLNLLPDIKKEYLKSQHKKRLFIMGSFMIIVVAIGSVALMSMYTFGVQKLQILNSQDSINDSVKTLGETPDLAKMVSVQNQLSALPGLHDSKTAVTKLFDFLKILTPNDVSLSSIIVNFEESIVEIKGTGKDFKAVNTFVDTLKNASYVYTENDESALAFESVVLSRIGKEDESASFKIEMSYDPLIFDNTTEGLKMSVPNITSTRSETEKPSSLFDSDVEEDEK